MATAFNPFTRNTAAVARKAVEDRKVRENAAALATVAARIAESSAPADFLGTADGIRLVLAVHDLLERDELYHAARKSLDRFVGDLEAEFGFDREQLG